MGHLGLSPLSLEPPALLVVAVRPPGSAGATRKVCEFHRDIRPSGQLSWVTQLTRVTRSQLHCWHVYSMVSVAWDSTRVDVNSDGWSGATTGATTVLPTVTRTGARSHSPGLVPEARSCLPCYAEVFCWEQVPNPTLATRFLCRWGDGKPKAGPALCGGTMVTHGTTTEWWHQICLVGLGPCVGLGQGPRWDQGHVAGPGLCGGMNIMRWDQEHL